MSEIPPAKPSDAGQESAATLKLNTVVRITGLKGQVRLNGAEGTIVGVAENGRFAVRIDRPRALAKEFSDGVRIKSDNLEVVPDRFVSDPAPAARPPRARAISGPQVPRYSPEYFAKSLEGLEGTAREKRRESLAMEAVNELFQCVGRGDRFPFEAAGALFGIQPPKNARDKDGRDVEKMSVGALVYWAWMCPWRVKVEAIARAHPQYVEDSDDDDLDLMSLMSDPNARLYSESEYDYKMELVEVLLENNMQEYFKELMQEMLDGVENGKRRDYKPKKRERGEPLEAAEVLWAEGWGNFPSEHYVRELKRREFEGLTFAPFPQ